MESGWLLIAIAFYLNRIIRMLAATIVMIAYSFEESFSVFLINTLEA